MTTSPPATTNRLYAVNGSGPAPVDQFADGPAAVGQVAAPLLRHLTELRRRIGGLRDLVGSGAVAAPLQDAAAAADEELHTLLDFARVAIAELLATRAESAGWASIVGRIRTIALAPSNTQGGLPIAESAAEAEVLNLWQGREHARNLVVSLEGRNARLSEASAELAGARAYARALEERMTGWVQRGRPVTDGSVKAAVRHADAAGTAAHAEATAAALAAAAHAEIGG